MQSSGTGPGRYTRRYRDIFGNRDTTSHVDTHLPADDFGNARSVLFLEQ